MADEKYGRLFTGEDVDDLLAHAMSGLAQAVAQARGGTATDDELRPLHEALNAARALLTPKFPEDEPLFLLRGKDLLAPAAVKAYVEVLLEQGDIGLANEVGEKLAAIRSWQRENRGRVGLPD